MTTIAMMLVQALLGVLRPNLGNRGRRPWRRAHQIWGWLSLLMGAIKAVLIQDPCTSMTFCFWNMFSQAA
jgi:uncharacterized membrane protein